MTLALHRRPFDPLWFLLAVATLGLACGEDERSRSPAPAAAQNQSDPELTDIARRVRSGRAAKEGIVWMIDHHTEMPTGWAYPFFRRLQRVVGDTATRAQIGQIIEEDALVGVHVAIPKDFEDPLSLRPAHLMPVLFELERRKQVGLSYADSVRALGERIARDESAFWRPVKLTQQAAYLHLFAILDIGTQRTLDDLIAEARATGEQRSATEMGADLPFVYALTHLVLARSGYFRRGVDTEEFDFALPAFRAALTHALETPASDHFFDLSAEILVCYGLLRLPGNALTQQTLAHILRRQNPDGSWGSGQGADHRRVHMTFNSVMANLLYPR